MADQDDVVSITTEGSNWCFVEAEEGDMPAEESLKSSSEEENDDEWSEAGSDPFLMPEASMEPKPVPTIEVSPSAAILRSSPFELGHPLLAQCSEHGGDITSSWAKALEGFPTVSSIFSLGRLSVSPTCMVRAANGAPVALPMVARAVVFNNGLCTWPEATELRIVAGDPFGLHSLPCGNLPPGCGAELVLDLAVPAAAAPGTGSRSAWVLTDGNGEPFGPVLVVEVVWM